MYSVGFSARMALQASIPGLLNSQSAKSDDPHRAEPGPSLAQLAALSAADLGLQQPPRAPFVPPSLSKHVNDLAGLLERCEPAVEHLQTDCSEQQLLWQALNA